MIEILASLGGVVVCALVAYRCLRAPRPNSASDPFEYAELSDPSPAARHPWLEEDASFDPDADLVIPSPPWEPQRPSRNCRAHRLGKLLGVSGSLRRL
jgi:hypothetical protein